MFTRVFFFTLLLINGPSNSAELDFSPCLVSSKHQQIDALCATFVRPENPHQTTGDTIELSVIKLASLAPEPELDAFTIIQGGPGGSSIDLSVGYAGFLEGVRKHRDVLVLDQRGTGRSNSLKCPQPDSDSQPTEFDSTLIRQQASDCIDTIESDLRFYTTSLAVDDLEALRDATGYPRLTIYGVSYGTRVAQHFLRKYPKSSRAIILDGVVNVGLNLAGGEIARRSQAALDLLVLRCQESTDCEGSFGDIRLKLTELIARLAKTPIDIRLPDPISGKVADKRLSQDDVLGVLRLMAYSTESNSLLPLIISEAHAGNYLPLAAQSIMIGGDFFDGYSIGMNNSVMCTEDAPYVTKEDTENLDGTYFGNLMVEAMKATCEVWPLGVIDQQFHQPFDTDVPILILSGETDPITPPENGEYAHNMFSNSRHFIVPAHGHGVLMRGCVPQLTLDFIETGLLTQLDPSCIEREQAMPFFNSSTGPKP